MQNQLSWQRLEGQGNYPSSREGHTFTYCPAINCYLLFGGIGTQRTNETHSFNVQTSTWKLLEIAGKLPPERNAHVAWVDEPNNILYIHGGQSAKRDSLADLQALSLTTLTWTRIYTSEQQPSGRTHHALAVIGGVAYVFGGMSGESLLMDDVWSFAFKNVDWSRHEPHAPAWSQETPSGRGPRPRKAHSMISYRGDLYIFGGITSKGHANDLYQLRVADMHWRHIKSHESVAPTPRAFHSAALFNDRYMVVFGGIQSLKDTIKILDDLLLLDLQQMDWSLPFAGGILPSSRYGHALATGRDPLGKQQLVLVGGLDRTYCVMEVYCLEEIRLLTGQKWTIQEVKKAQESAAQADLTIMSNKKRLKEIEGTLFAQRDKAYFPTQSVPGVRNSRPKREVSR